MIPSGRRSKKPGFVKAMWCGCQECEEKDQKKIHRQHPDVYLLSRNRSLIPVSAAENRRQRWCTGEKHINLKEIAYETEAAAAGLADH